LYHSQHNAYAVICIANEGLTDVLFDDIELNHKRLIWQENNYYPFGMSMASIDKVGSNSFTYNGKEEEESGYLDFHARQQDRQLGRFTSIDPLADKQGQASWSPYHYTLNNPINRIDPDGRSSVTVTGKKARRMFRRMRNEARQTDPSYRLSQINHKLGGKMDRLYKRGKRQEREWGFTIVKNKRGKIRARNVVHSPDEDDPTTTRDESKTTIHWNFKKLKKEDKVIGMFHTHPFDNKLTQGEAQGDFESFSLKDIKSFMEAYHFPKSYGLKNKMNYAGFTTILQGVDGRYVLTVENYKLARRSVQRYPSYSSLYRKTGDALQGSNYGNVLNTKSPAWNFMARLVIASFAGESSKSGIGFYYAPNNLSFKKLN